MMNMVERVARAIYTKALEQRSLGPLGQTWDFPYWENAADQDKKYAIGEARAAIEAMREPTDAMEDAAYKHDDSGAQLSCGYGEIYTVMITAALEEK